MSEENNYDYKAIDAVVNIWTREALSQRPDWGDDFFVGKMNAKDSLMTGLSLDEMVERMETAGIEKAFLIAAHAGRVGMPGCYHMPYEVVARACEEYPDRFYGLAGIDPFDGMDGVRAFEDAVQNMGFIGAHLYPHWYELAPDHAKYYPFYAKCCELATFCIKRIVFGMIRRQFVPMRIKVSTDKTHVLHRIFECSHAIHAIKRINASQSIKTIGIFLARSGNDFIGHVVTPWHANPSCMSSDQKCFLNACCFHSLNHLIERKTGHKRVFGIHLSNKEIIAPIGSL